MDVIVGLPDLGHHLTTPSTRSTKHVNRMIGVMMRPRQFVRSGMRFTGGITPGIIITERCEDTIIFNNFIYDVI